jgi:hypothetical protein
MTSRNFIFRVLGYLYKLLHLVPVLGDGMVRGIGAGIAYASYNSPYGIKEFVCMDDFRKRFEELAKMADLPIEVNGHDDERLRLTVKWCPYGFTRPSHREVCRAAMYMDEKMYGYCGAKLVIDESIPDGDPACRCSIYAPGKAPGGKGGAG